MTWPEALAHIIDAAALVAVVWALMWAIAKDSR